MGLAVVTVVSGGLPITESVMGGTPVTEATNGYGVPVTKVAARGLPVVFETIGVVAPVTYATWDAATVTAVTLSGGGLVATNTGTTSTDQGVKVIAASGKTTGKYYFEVTCTLVDPLGINGPNRSIGIGTTGSTYTGMGNSATTGCAVYISGNIWVSGSNTSTNIGGLSTGVTVGVAADITGRLAWFRSSLSSNWNGSGSNSPGGAGGKVIPAGTIIPFCTFGGSGGTVGQVFTANFGASAFVGAVPAGFTSGWPA
jgi:hypothetical protein